MSDWRRTMSVRSGQGTGLASSVPPAPDVSAARARALLQVWLSPSFPVGAFAYSHGLERAVNAGWVADRPSLELWLADIVTHGALPNDLIVLAVTWRAVRAGDIDALATTAELAAALQPSAERHLEATQQGMSFVQQIEAAWPAGERLWTDFVPDIAPTHAVAVGWASALHGLPLDETLNAYAVAFIGNLTSVAIRLSVIGQTDAQRVSAALIETLLSAAVRAGTATLDDLGAATWRSDLASLQHETQHTRLFRS